VSTGSHTDPGASPAAPAPRRAPPSFPTRRSRVIRDALFAAAVVAWVGAMYAVWRENQARALTEAESDEIAVFTDAFEPNLRLLVKAKIAGVSVAGEHLRRTKEPWDGRLVMRDRMRIGAAPPAGPGVLELDAETHWDRGAGGFRRGHGRARFFVPGFVDMTLHASLTRTRDARAGDMLVLRTDALGGDPRRPVPIRIPPGTDVSMDLMPPAQLRPVRVGLKWETQAVSWISGKVTSASVEVVEKGRVTVAGVETTAYRAVTRIEKETGRSVEAGETWYDAEGRALVQTLRAFPLELTLERAERLAASDEEFDRLAMPEGGPDDGAPVQDEAGEIHE